MSVTHKDTLKRQIETMHHIIRKSIDDISEEESIWKIGSSPNHIKWQAGHLVFTAVLAGRALGTSIQPPAGWEELFGRGEEPPEDQKNLPSMAEIRQTLYDFQKRVLTHVEEVTEEHLLIKRQISGPWEDTPLNAVLFLCGHDFYHCGQIALIRRELGRERNFG